MTPLRALQTIVRGKLRVKPLVACVLLPLAIGDLAGTSAVAATLLVTNCNDAGNGSLRAALATAHNNDRVDLTALTCGTISLATGELSITVDNLTLQGPGADALTIAGSQVPAHGYTVLHHIGHGTLQLDSLRITDSHAAYEFGGPSSCVASSGTVYLNRSTVTDCSNGAVLANGFSARYSTISNSSQGIYTLDGNVSIYSSTISGNNSYLKCTAMHLGRGGPPVATALISNSTISGNGSFYFPYYGHTSNSAGCIYEPVTIRNSTIAFNWSRSSTGGMGIFAPEATIESSIFAHNDRGDLAAQHVGGHNNLIMSTTVAVPPDTIRTDPLLLPLADNGGPTQTHALAPGSPAIDAGNNAAGLATDERGVPFARSVGAGPDIGAFELQTPAATIDASFTGSWYDPNQSGQGIMLEVLPGKQVLALWFAFSPGGKQAWFGGLGTYLGNTATIPGVALPTGGQWIPNFDPGKVVRNTWGTLTFTFSDHDNGKVDFSSVYGYGNGSMKLTRLTSAVAGVPAATATGIGPPVGVTTDSAGNVYFSSNENLVFKLDTQSKVTRIAGTGVSGYAGDGGPATLAQLNFPLSYPELVHDPIDFGPLVGGIAVDAQGRVYIADAYNNRVRRIGADGTITTVAGTGTPGHSGDFGPATSAQIYWPQGVAVDGSGNFYFTTAYATLRKVNTTGQIFPIADDNCGPSYLGPGFCVPEEIAIDAAGNLYVPDIYCRVREVRLLDGAIFTVAGSDKKPANGSAFTCGYSGDGGPATQAALAGPYGVAVDKSGNLFIADTYNGCIRKVDAAGIISTVAGLCSYPWVDGFEGDGGPATSAKLARPFGVAVDDAGNLYIADTYNNRVRKVSTDGIITTIAGNGAAYIASTTQIGPAYSGSWYDPAQSGQGLMLEVLSDNRLLALWFTFSPTGEQAWFGGVGTYNGNTATITGVALPTGGKWIPNFDPNAVVRNAWGTLTLTFGDCNHGKVAFNSGYDGYGSGSMNLMRLTLPLGQACQ